VPPEPPKRTDGGGDIPWSLDTESTPGVERPRRTEAAGRSSQMRGFAFDPSVPIHTGVVITRPRVLEVLTDAPSPVTVNHIACGTAAQRESMQAVLRTFAKAGSVGDVHGRCTLRGHLILAAVPSSLNDSSPTSRRSVRSPQHDSGHYSPNLYQPVRRTADGLVASGTLTANGIGGTLWNTARRDISPTNVADRLGELRRMDLASQRGKMWSAASKTGAHRDRLR